MRATTAPRRTARLTGIGYLGIVVAGIFAEFFVRMSLVVPGDPAATAGNIAGSPGLFGAGVAADLLMIALDVAVAIGLYRLLRPVDRPLALAATAFRLVQATILAANLTNAVRAWAFAQRAVETGAAGPAARALQAMESFALTYDGALIAFGLACLALGRLLRRSRAVPTILAVAMTLTGAVYLVGSLDAVLALGWSSLIDPLYGVAIVAEPAFALWLIVKGINPTTRQASAQPHAVAV